jgi:hypothetical protein
VWMWSFEQMKSYWMQEVPNLLHLIFLSREHLPPWRQIFSYGWRLVDRSYSYKTVHYTRL